jgi:TM2 domain-containing membrane protein YozV
MTTGPDESRPEPTQPYGSSYGSQPPPPPPPPAPGQVPYGAPVAPGAYGAAPGAPYGIHPGTGIPYSDKSKIIAGILQILLPFGIGRFYIGDNRLGVIQLVVTLVTCGVGSLWPIIDGIIMLVTDSKDARGYVLRS